MRQIEITSGLNGYPSNIRKAMAFFENIEEAKAYAEEVGVDDFHIVEVRKRDGWDLWEERGWATSPLSLYNKYANQDQYVIYLNSEDYRRDAFEELKSVIEDWDSLDEVKFFLDQCERVGEEIDQMPEGYFAVVSDNEVKKIHPCTAMDYHDDDVWHYAIAVLLPKNEEDEE